MSCPGCGHELRYNGFENYPTGLMLVEVLNGDDSEHWRKRLNTIAKDAMCLPGMSPYIDDDTFIAARLAHELREAKMQKYNPKENSTANELMRYGLQVINWIEIAEQYMQFTKAELLSGDGEGSDGK